MIIGIDPGLTGAVAFIEQGKLKALYDIPVMANGKGKSKVKNQVNPAELVRLLARHTENEEVTVYLERISAMPGQGVASMFSMGDTFGTIRGVCAALGFRVEVITPQSWKKHFKLGKDKEICRAKAIEMYPEAPLELKKHHNRAESILIAVYGERS